MEIKSTYISSFNCFEIEGRLDQDGIISMQKHIDDKMKNGAKFFIFDFAKLEYINSSGLRILIKTQKKLKLFDGLLTIINPNQNVKTLLDISGMTELLRLKGSFKEAINEFTHNN